MSTVVSNYNLPPLPECLKGSTVPKANPNSLEIIEPIYENVSTLINHRELLPRRKNESIQRVNRNIDRSNMLFLKDSSILKPKETTHSFTRLKEKMRKLRELDRSLLQELNALNDSMHQYRLVLNERHLDETNSEYSYASIDRDMDSISSVDEFDYLTDDVAHESPVTTPVGPRGTNVFYQINELHEKMQTELNI